VAWSSLPMDWFRQLTKYIQLNQIKFPRAILHSIQIHPCTRHSGCLSIRSLLVLLPRDFLFSFTLFRVPPYPSSISGGGKTGCGSSRYSFPVEVAPRHRHPLAYNFALGQGVHNRATSGHLRNLFCCWQSRHCLRSRDTVQRGGWRNAVML
jgi:hypothetical protein